MQASGLHQQFADLSGLMSAEIHDSSVSRHRKVWPSWNHFAWTRLQVWGLARRHNEASSASGRLEYLQNSGECCVERKGCNSVGGWLLGAKQYEKAIICQLSYNQCFRSQQHSKIVPWMRKTEYISTEFNRYGVNSDRSENKIGYSIKKRMGGQDNFYKDQASQIAAIQKIFDDVSRMDSSKILTSFSDEQASQEALFKEGRSCCRRDYVIAGRRSVEVFVCSSHLW